MGFQAGVATWFAAHLAASSPVGGRFGLGVNAVPTRLQMETGRYLDDIEVDLSGGGRILVQCKTRPSLSPSPDSPLASTISQLVDFVVSTTQAGDLPDPTMVAAVLAVADDASGGLDDLEHACRFFNAGADWSDALNGFGKARGNALKIFAAHARRAWALRTSSEPDDGTMVLLARLFHIIRFSIDGEDDRQAARVLGASLLKDEGEGASALPALKGLVRRLMINGAPATRQGIIEELRRAGVEDTRNPVFDGDFAALRAHTDRELIQLDKHTRLPYGEEGILIERHCHEPLAEAVAGGSLLVIGEPGAGKTGVLVELARRLGQTGPCLFLSIDRFEGVRLSSDIDQVLTLNNPLEEVLAAWPGSAPAVLIIDALDASRGGPAEGVFANLIQDLMARLGERWSIVASIRTFDLKNGTRFRQLMGGEPPTTANADPDLLDVRHFLVPRLSPEERRSIGASHPEFLARIESAPEPVKKLLANVFNLSLAADLIENAAFHDLGRINSQSDLIDLYQDLRIPDQDMVVAVKNAIEVMVERRNLTVRRSALQHPSVQRVLKSGVLVLVGDRIAFAHHVLFDHATGRYLLEYDDPARLEQQIAADRTIGFLLGPAFRFAMERMWQGDAQGKPGTWRFVTGVAANQQVDPILSSIALRSASERIEGPADVSGLSKLILLEQDVGAMGRAVSKIARFGRMATSGSSRLSAFEAEAWANVASACIATKAIEYADAARTLLLLLYEKADLEPASTLAAVGKAARAFLRYAWETGEANQALTTIAIRAVCRTFASSPSESRQLLEQILTSPHFEEHAHEEAPWLAEGVPSIAPHDPEFALLIYRALFGRSSPQQGQNWFAGQASQIMPLLGSKEQDYEHARWHLTRGYPAFIQAAPSYATKAASAFAIGTTSTEGLAHHGAEVNGRPGPRIVEDHKSIDDWRRHRRGGSEEGILTAFTAYLRTCSRDAFEACVDAALEEETASSVWARLFGTGAERHQLMADLLWPLAEDLELLTIFGMSRDVLLFLTAAFPSRAEEDRARFELSLAARVEGDRDWDGPAARFLSDLDPIYLVTREGKALRERLQAEGDLRGNEPYSDFSIRSETVDTDFLLSRSGIAVSSGPDGELRDLVRPLEGVLKEFRDDVDPERIASLWNGLEQVIDALDRLEVAEDSSRAAWAAVGEAVERLSESPDYLPSKDGHPSLSRLLEIIDRLAASPYPEPKEVDDSGMMSWGNWDIRIYAGAANLDVARRFGREAPDAIARLERYLDDPVGTVRLQVAQAINALWSVAPNEMWRLADRVAEREAHPGVLAFFVSGPLYHVFDLDPQKCDVMVRAILERVAQQDSSRSDRSDRSFHEAMGHLAAQQWVGRAYLGAKSWIDGWVANLVRDQDYLWHLISSMRFPLFAGYAESGPENDAMQARAKALVEAIAEKSEELQSQTRGKREEPGDDDTDVVDEQAAVRAADNMLDHIGAQLYFGSGAYEGKGPDLNGLRDVESKTFFLRDYRALLTIIGRSGSPRTLHQLIELYEFLIEGDAEGVFDEIAGILLGQGANSDYHRESLASDGLVRLVRLYLADYRSVFDEPSRRSRLVAILELFSGAGWPEALNLLYDLPDLLR